VDLGPLELLVIGFPGNQFNGEIAPELGKLVEAGTIRIVDLIFMSKDADGATQSFELAEIDDGDLQSAFNAVVASVDGLITEEDIEDIAEALDPNSSAAMLLFEHTWATPFADALRASGGELIDAIRIPREAVEAVVAARQA